MIQIEIPVKSATYAMKGKQVLHKNGIRGYIGKRSGEHGCFYYLNVHEKYLKRARELLEEEAIIKEG